MTLNSARADRFLLQFYTCHNLRRVVHEDSVCKFTNDARDFLLSKLSRVEIEKEKTKFDFANS